jgi:hypothetical protein
MKKGLVENILILSLSQNHHSSNNKTNQKVSLSQLITTSYCKKVYSSLRCIALLGQHKTKIEA